MDTRVQDNLIAKQHDYVAPFLWLHGEEKELIFNELDRIYECGIRSVCLESRVHEEFCEAGWWSDVEDILEACQKKGMRVWILDEKRFPTGYSNGIFVEKHKELRPWGITEAHLDIVGPIENGSAIVDGWKMSTEDEVVAVVACRRKKNSSNFDGEVVDLTEKYYDGMVYFSLPDGIWRIYILLKTRTGMTDRFQTYCDMLEPEAVRLYIQEVYDSHYVHFKEYFGNTLRGFFSDEPGFHNNSQYDRCPLLGSEYSHFPWHENVLTRLIDKYGKDARKMLPGLWADLPGVSEKIRYAYMNVVSDEFRKNFSNQIGDWCRRHGVEYIGHVIEDNESHAATGTGAGHYFRGLAGQDMAGIDVVLHQIVPGLKECPNAGLVPYKHMNSRFFNYVLAKLGSSLAHIDPRKKGRTMCEIFGAYGWAEGTKIMKYLTDHMLVRGINYYVPHAFSPKPNDPDCPPNFYDSGKNPLYKYFYRFMDYLNRASYLLSDGIHVPVAAILYDAEARWIGREFLPQEDVAKSLCEGLLDYDIVPADVLGQMDEEGCINGEKYSVLVVPYNTAMPQDLKEIVSQVPIKVVIVLPDEMADQRNTADFMCGKNADVVTISELVAHIRNHIWKDVVTDYSGNGLRYYHYMRNGSHIYMFTNEDIHNRIKTDVSLSAFTGGSYIVYDAFENKAWQGRSENGRINIELDSYHSIFILCGDVSYEGISDGQLWNHEILKMEEQSISPVFRVSVAKEGEREYRTYKDTDQLINITGQDELPAFSGNIKYEGAFEIADSGEYQLDLGYVGETADLYVNGIHIGHRVFPPYRFDITDAVCLGSNSFEIIVSNHNGYERRDKFSKYLLFEPSGLLGPMVLKRFTC